MIVTHHREKLINASIYFVQHTKDCSKVKLFKLLYCLDFLHFKQTGKSVTGLEYLACDVAPVPCGQNKKLLEMLSLDVETFQKIYPQKIFNFEFFTKREKRLLELLAETFQDAKAEDMNMSAYLKNDPWGKTLKEKGSRALIDYLLAIDSDDPESISYEEAVYRISEREEMYLNFGKADLVPTLTVKRMMRWKNSKLIQKGK